MEQARLDREEVRHALREDRTVDRQLFRGEREADREEEAAQRNARLLQAKRDNKDVVNIDLGLGITQEYEVVSKFLGDDDIDELVKKKAELDELNAAIEKKMEKAERENKEKYLADLEKYNESAGLMLQARSRAGTANDCAIPAMAPPPKYQALKPPAKQGISDEDLTWTVKLKSKSAIGKNPSITVDKVNKLPAQKLQCAPGEQPFGMKPPGCTSDVPCVPGAECGACQPGEHNHQANQPSRSKREQLTDFMNRIIR